MRRRGGLNTAVHRACRQSCTISAANWVKKDTNVPFGTPNRRSVARNPSSMNVVAVMKVRITSTITGSIKMHGGALAPPCAGAEAPSGEPHPVAAVAHNPRHAVPVDCANAAAAAVVRPQATTI